MLKVSSKEVTKSIVSALIPLISEFPDELSALSTYFENGGFEELISDASLPTHSNHEFQIVRTSSDFTNGLQMAAR